MNARQVIQSLLDNPFPHDFIAVRKTVQGRYHGNEEAARAKMQTYCSQDFLDEQFSKWSQARIEARLWLNNPENQ